ncbi:hypothetical protein JKP11_20900 [Vibrio vulnificus]|uniref:hypothetical protein n=1 Tax=Vibrio vulnificus TaxID=672 RepID=UPI001CDB6046|nr:hypothetical protein [Vibrio vulnificus]MCA3958106.1 hypothetical protein [Vibrio vulnificus]MDS1829053.1 hypothetical protein [Vibrio vulnificus]
MKIRCLAKKDGDVYVAMSLDFGLACQADTLIEAKNKLAEQIEEYIVEAVNEDKEHKNMLLNRKGPLSWFVSYYVFKIMNMIHIKSREFCSEEVNFSTRSMKHA